MMVNRSSTFKHSPANLIGIQRGILWSREDYPKLKEYMDKIHMYRWLGDFNSAFRLTAFLNIFIRKQYNDHKPSQLHKTKVSAIDAGIADNKITAPGVIGIVNQLANQSVKFFIYMSMGIGTTVETIGQKKLTQEVVRVSVLRDGSMAARGNVWNHVGNFGYGVTTNKYWEFGIHACHLPSNITARYL